MPHKIPPGQRVHRILKKCPAYIAPDLILGRKIPKGVGLSDNEECLGLLVGEFVEAILSDRGVFFCKSAEWTFVEYGEIKDVTYPEKSDAQGALTLHTSRGEFKLLSGNPALWEVGRFFTRCADDAN